jgi:hypothetical protein
VVVEAAAAAAVVGVVATPAAVAAAHVNGAAVDGIKGVDLEVHDDEDGWETVSDDDDDEDDGDYIPNDADLTAKGSDKLDSYWEDDSFGRVDEDEASHSADSEDDDSEFYQLCQDLKRNDPNTTAVLTAQMPVPKGYALPLGRALYFGDNQRIHLELDPDRLLLTKHDDKALYPLMDYLWEATALQLLRISGKAAYTDGDVFMLMIPVAENHRLEELELLTDMAYHVNALREVMEGTTSIRSLVICLDRFYEVNDVPDDAREQSPPINPWNALLCTWKASRPSWMP